MDLLLKTKYHTYNFSTFIKKNKFLVFISIILFIALYYFIFLREIRDINVSGTYIDSKSSDISVSLDLRSKKEIQSVTIDYSFDNEIKNEINYKDEYQSYINNFKKTFSYVCNSKKCSLTNDSLSLKDLFSWINSFKKDYLIDDEEQEVAASMLAAQQQQASDDNLTLENNFGEEINSELMSDELANDFVDNWMWSNTLLPWMEKQLLDFTQQNWLVDSSYDSISSETILVESEINCKEEKYTFHPNCYKTPNISLEIKWVTINYSIVFLDWTVEKGNRYLKLKGTSILIKWD